MLRQVPETDSVIYYTYTQDSLKSFYRGQYELSNHLGNVLAVITDRRIQACGAGDVMHYEAQVVSVSDYYPFGMGIKEREWSDSSFGYRYGFNGQEGDDEVAGEGNSYDFGARIYDSRLGRWMSVDPLMKKYPSLSAYSFVGNCPILFIDPDGRIIDLSKLSDSHKALYNTMLAKLSKSELHSYVYKALESSTANFTIVFDENLKAAGKYNTETGTITINPNKVTENVSVLSEEMFHGFQFDSKDELYPDGVSAQNIEAEGDIYKEYVDKQLSGQPEEVPLKGGGFIVVGGYNPQPQDFNFCAEFFNLCESYEEGVNGLPSREQMESTDFLGDFSSLITFRYETNKDNSNLPPSYRAAPSNTAPNSLTKAVTEASASNLAGPRLENGDYYGE